MVVHNIVKQQICNLESKLKTTPKRYSAQYLAASLAFLTSLSIGLNFGWSSPTLPILLSPGSPISLTLDQVSWVFSIQPLGDLCGAPLSGLLSDLIGRKRTLLLSTIPHFFGWILTAYSSTFWHLIIARILSGIASGMINQSLPMYIGEISEPEIRGTLGSGITLVLISGCTAINLIGGLLDIQATALICATIPLITLMTFCWMPESPYYYIIKGRWEEAKQSLQYLRKQSEVDEELNTIREHVEQQMKTPTSYSSIFINPFNRKIFLIVIFVRIVQQLSGLAAVTMFLLLIFVESGLSIPPLVATMIFLIVQMISTTFCTIYCDKFGRVPLLMISLIGAGLSSFSVGSYFFARDFLELDMQAYSYVPLVGMLCYIVVFSIGYGTMPTLIAAELFPTNIKSKGMCLSHYVFAICVFTSSKLFLTLHSSFGMYMPFMVYTVGAVFGLFFTWFCVPETKGKSLQEIQRIFNSKA